MLAQWERGELDPDASGMPGVSRQPSTANGGFHRTSIGGLDSRSSSFNAKPRVGIAMTPATFWEPSLSEPSALMTAEDVRCLAGAVPARLAPGRWQLLYGSARDGISLRTLYRKAAGRAPTLLIVREAGASGHVFGAFATEAWKPGPKFYGTGETFVFTLQPQRVRYAWQRPKAAAIGSGGGGGYSGGGGGGGGPLPYNDVSGAEHPLAAQQAAGGGSASAAAAAAAAAAAGGSGRTDFFQFSTHEGLGVGGCGHFALWLDNELLEGASYSCDTFGSPRLSGKEEFHVAGVELWQL